MKREEFDQLFDHAFEDAARSSEFIPDPEPSWAKVEKKLAKRAKVKRLLKLAPYLAASFLLGAYIFGTPAVSIAFQPIIKAVATIKDGVVEITVGEQENANTIPKTAPPPGYEGDGGTSGSDGQDVPGGGMEHKVYDTPEEAAEHLSFRQPEIGYVAEPFELTSVDTFRMHDMEKADQMSVLYERKTGEYGLYRITIKKFLPGTLMKITSGNSKIKMETITVNKYEAYLQLTSDGSASLQYFVDDLHVWILGALTGDEIIAIAENLRFNK
ncbi:DUF4367 domain-containing protein [Paenibacillus sp. LHD-117]|uniref:DUF4367 domain-containing protein n=1 Tax=Paenibacillus sp. LHD-117 TaxID=3071412 RepID=UPI0027E1A4E6|nr:DUF4367 domain-containing protein [Paenibacillus sp. LHD-117]MDQ6419541.1 DUF4367 domain-containing protein [Paenibacillus sp. LHD-117]